MPFPKKSTKSKKPYKSSYFKKSYKSKVPRSLATTNGEGVVMRFRKIVQHYSAAGVLYANVPTQDPSSITEFGSMVTLYDSYTVEKFKVRAFPTFTQSAVDDAAQTTPVDVTGGYKPLYVVYDPDSTGISGPTKDKYVQYDNLKIINLFKPWSYTVKPGVQAGSSSLQNAAIKTWRGRPVLDTNVANGNTLGVISWYTEGLPTIPSTTVPQFEAIYEYTCRFYNRR